MSPTHLVIDLHTHSTASDGTESPAQLLASAAAAGVTTLAITDHDTVSGWDEATEAALEHGIALVRGIEISTKRDGKSIHLLGYLLDPTHPGLLAEVDRTREARDTRLESMVAKLRDEGGLDISHEEVLARVPAGATAGRPHIADAMVDKGLVPHRDQAFEQWLHNDSPFYVRHYAPDTAAAVQLVRDAGGVPVLAHPFSITRGRSVPDALVEELAELGLGGIEVEHRDHDASARARARGLAASLGLFMTGSSDYHGAGKRNRLAENTTEPQVLARIKELATSGVSVVRP